MASEIRNCLGQHHCYNLSRILILVVVVCGVILNYMGGSGIPQQPPPQPRTVSIPESAATSVEEDEGDVKEVLGVKIYKNPSQSKLHHLAVASWPTWEGRPGQMPWTFSTKETMHIVEGRVKVCCVGVEEVDDDDVCFEIVGGDLVEFPKGMKITWNVIDAVKKHYHLHD